MTSAHLATNAIVVLTSMLALGWLWHAIAALRGIPILPDLVHSRAPLPDLEASEGPDVTVIVPACNEEQSIEATLKSLLGSTGARLQIVAIDDRSTDRTGERMDAVADEALASVGLDGMGNGDTEKTCTSG